MVTFNLGDLQPSTGTILIKRYVAQVFIFSSGTPRTEHDRVDRRPCFQHTVSTLKHTHILFFPVHFVAS